MLIEIPITEKDNWRKHLLEFSEVDFYHTYNYHELACVRNEGYPVLLLMEQKGYKVIFPLLLRSLENLENSFSKFYDATSVYGYGGPLISVKNFPLEILQKFQEELKEYLIKKKVIAAFSRLHPLLNQKDLLEGIGEIQDLNKTVAIDLTIPADKQRAKYRKSNKSEINQLRKRGYSIKTADSQSEIEAFVSIYRETMNRVNAQAYYYFDSAYFHQFLASTDFKPVLLLAYKDGEILAGAIFTITNHIMQYHLAGTTEKAIQDAPMKLIIDEARLLGNSLNLSTLHLGGGVGGKDDDPLFRFKSGFSDKFLTYSIWKYIADQKKYDELIALESKKRKLKENYFPAYRG